MRPILVFDADCGPCTRFARLVRVLDIHRELGFSSIQDAESEGILREIPRRLRYRSFHLILPEGTARSGAEALPTVFGFFPIGRLLRELATVPGLSAVLSFSYDVLSRMHETGSCVVPTTSLPPALDNVQKRITSNTGILGP